MKVSVLIPAFNEEHNIQKTIAALEKLKMTWGQKHPNLDWQVIVIDDGSSDGTYTHACAGGVHTLRLDHNRGKGGALRHGLKHANGDIVLFLDADLRESASEAHKLITPILEDKTDVTIAKFQPRKATPGGFGLVKALAALGIRWFTGHKITSALSGQRAFKRSVLVTISPIPEGYSLEVGMLIDILKQGYRVLEVDVDMCHDVTGRNWQGFLHRGRQFKDIMKMLVGKLGERRIIA